MSARRMTDKEQRKYGKRWRIQRSKPITRSTPPAAPWGYEATAAYDQSELSRKLPPLIALNFRRYEGENEVLQGFFDLRVVHWHLTIWGCLWFAVVDGRQWVVLPGRSWVDWHDHTHWERTISFDDVYEQRFCDAALVALHQLLERTCPYQPPPETNGHDKATPVTNGHDQPEGASEDSEPPPRTNGHLEATDPHDPPF